MRISDWSSDVCSSDLVLAAALDQAFDRDAGVAHRRGDFGEDADAVLDDQADVMFADARAGIGGGRRVERIDGHREGGAIFVARDVDDVGDDGGRSEEHTSELQSLMRISYAVFCLKKKKIRRARS